MYYGLSLDVYNVAELPHEQSPKPQWTLIRNKKATKNRGFSISSKS